MPDHDHRSNMGLLILAGIGAGAVTGTLLGLLAARRPRAATQNVMTETVDDLKRRAEQILMELSQAYAVAPRQPDSTARPDLKRDVLEGDRIEPHDEQPHAR